MAFRKAFGAALLPLMLLSQDTAGTGALDGTITGTQLAGTRVCLKEAARCVNINADGVFRFAGIRPGDYQLTVGALATTVAIRAGLTAQIQVDLPALAAQQQSITVRAGVFVVPEEIKTSSYLIGRHEIFKSSVAEQDVSRYVQSLPGVGLGRNDVRNDLIVRGGSPLENLFIVDNVEIPNINTFANFAAAGGLTAILDADLIGDVTFLTGGYPAPFTNRTSSVLQIATREGSRQGPSARVSASTLTGGAILEGPIGTHQRGSWLTSIKRSFIDAVTDDIGSGGVPVIYTSNTKVLYDLSARDRLWLVNFAAADRIRIGPVDNKPKEPEVERVDVNYQGWRTAGGLNWQHLHGDQAVSLFGITHSEAHVKQRVKDLGRYGFTGTVAEIVAQTPLLYRENSREAETTAKYDFTAQLPVLGKFQTGGSVKSFGLRYDTEQPNGSDNPYSALRDSNPFLLRGTLRAYQTGAYVQATHNLGSRLNLTWGGRFDHYQRLARTRFSPRVGLSYRVNEKLSLRGSAGQYYQQPLFLLIESFAQNRGLLPIRAAHAVAGLSYLLKPTVRFTVEAYGKQYKDYPVSSAFPAFSLATAGDTFEVTELLMPYEGAGRGSAKGVELFIEKKRTGRWYAQANAAFSRSRYSGLDGVLRPGTYDYPVVANAVVGVTIGRRWDLSSSYRFMSGRPYTPFLRAESEQQNRGIYNLKQLNALRTSSYIRPDIRLDRTLTVRGKPLLLWLGIQNVSNRLNVARVSWDQGRNESRSEHQRGRFPLFGIDWTL